MNDTIRRPRRSAAPATTPAPTAFAPPPATPTPAAPVPVAPPRAERSIAPSQRTPLAELPQFNTPLDSSEGWWDAFLENLTRLGISDVHVILHEERDSGDTPEERDKSRKQLVLKARFDGLLEDLRTISGQSATKMTNRLKVAAKLDTSTSSVPSDGQYELAIDGFPYRSRVVSLPLFDGGEKIVLRLPSIGELKDLDHVGFTASNRAAVDALIARPSGMVLIAGPMGEGKTSTAHALLMALGTADAAVVTVEDPVERVLPGVAQIEVNEEVGAGFGHVMKFLVRADFDTLFIGEIRDSETAAAAVRMAKAGRRVIATIHASDNVTAILRLMELSNDTPVSVLDAVSGVISQRLVRRIDQETNTYSGRTPIHEVLSVSANFADTVIENRSITDIRAAATSASTTFQDNLRELVDAGITDNSQARKVLGFAV